MSALAIETRQFGSTSELTRYLDEKGYRRVPPMKSLWKNNHCWAHIALIGARPALVIQHLHKNQDEEGEPVVPRALAGREISG